MNKITVFESGLKGERQEKLMELLIKGSVHLEGKQEEIDDQIAFIKEQMEDNETLVFIDGRKQEVNEQMVKYDNGILSSRRLIVMKKDQYEDQEVPKTHQDYIILI